MLVTVVVSTEESKLIGVVNLIASVVVDECVEVVGMAVVVST